MIYLLYHKFLHKNLPKSAENHIAKMFARLRYTTAECCKCYFSLHLLRTCDSLVAQTLIIV